MSLGQWTQYTVGSPTIQINFSTPVADAGSLRLINTANERTLLVSTVYSLGVLKGRMRTLIRFDTVTGPVSSKYRCGLTLFQSAADVAATGSGYQFGVEVEPSITVNNTFFDTFTAGVDDSRTRYFTGTNFSRVNGTTLVAIEIEWAYEPVLLGGTRFIFREGVGTLTDFSNLTESGRLILYPGQGTGAAPFLSTSAGEGVFSSGSTDATTFTVNIDKTTIVSLT